MISARFIQMVSDHWQEIAERVIRRIRRDKRLPDFEKYTDADLRERARIILQSLGTWLTSTEPEIAQRCEHLARVRFEEGVPLHVIVYALQTIRRSLIQYLRDQGVVSRPFEIYAEHELESDADRAFEAVIYHTVRSYEQALRETPGKFGSAVKQPCEGPELPWPI